LIQVLIVTPYASVRAGLRSLLAEAEDCAIVGEARDVEELQRLLPAVAPDVVLFDDSAGALEPVLALLQNGDSVRVTLCEDEWDVSLLARSNLRGWAALLRSADGEEIAGGIRAAHAGIIALDRQFAPLVATDLHERDDTGSEAEDADETLTAREREVLQLMAQGLPNKNIAARLHISLSTAKFHVASILAKLGVSSRTEAVTTGAKRGLVSL
jgi:DNA-binding NarL/FixJ family response regulator